MVNSCITSQSLCEIWEQYPYGRSGQKTSPCIVLTKSKKSWSLLQNFRKPVRQTILLIGIIWWAQFQSFSNNTWLCIYIEKLTKFQLQLPRVSTPIPTPTPGVSTPTPTPTPASLLNINSNSNSGSFNSNSNSNSGKSLEYQLQLQLQLRRFQLQFQLQLRSWSWSWTQLPTPNSNSGVDPNPDWNGSQGPGNLTQPWLNLAKDRAGNKNPRGQTLEKRLYPMIQCYTPLDEQRCWEVCSAPGLGCTSEVLRGALLILWLNMDL